MFNQAKRKRSVDGHDDIAGAVKVEEQEEQKEGKAPRADMVASQKSTSSSSASQGSASQGSSQPPAWQRSSPDDKWGQPAQPIPDAAADDDDNDATQEGAASVCPFKWPCAGTPLTVWQKSALADDCSSDADQYWVALPDMRPIDEIQKSSAQHQREPQQWLGIHQSMTGLNVAQLLRWILAHKYRHDTRACAPVPGELLWDSLIFVRADGMHNMFQADSLPLNLSPTLRAFRVMCSFRGSDIYHFLDAFE